MTPQQAKELLPIITAFAEGKTIQIKHISKGWIDTKFLYFDSVSSDYRIKPEPREFWVVIIEPNYRIQTHFTKESAENTARTIYSNTAKVVEIIHTTETLSD